MKRKNRSETVVEEPPVEVEPAPLGPEALTLPEDSGVQRLIRIPPPPPPPVQPLAPPYIIGFLPFSGSPGTQVEISGAGFVAVQSVTFGGIPAAFNVVSEGRIFASVPFGAASGPIRVTNPAGTAASFSLFTVTQASGQPAVTGFNPASGMPGDFITITGANFTGATRVTFNGVDASQFGVAGDNFISARVPVGATSGRVAVSNAAGTGQSPGIFTITGVFAQPPSITGFTPLGGPPGTLVRIFGSHFVGASQVLFGNGLAQFSVDADNQISAIVPPGASTGPVRVVTPGGTAVSFMSFALSGGNPVITSVSPAGGPPGTQVTIQGVNLSPLTNVLFGGVNAQSFNSLGQNFAIAVVPFGAFSGPLQVVTPAGSGFFPFTITRLPFQVGPLPLGQGVEG